MSTELNWQQRKAVHVPCNKVSWGAWDIGIIYVELSNELEFVRDDLVLGSSVIIVVKECLSVKVRLAVHKHSVVSLKSLHVGFVTKNHLDHCPTLLDISRKLCISLHHSHSIRQQFVDNLISVCTKPGFGYVAILNKHTTSSHERSIHPSRQTSSQSSSDRPFQLLPISR